MFVRAGLTQLRWIERLLQFVARFPEPGVGKPVGFKLCIGDHSEFIAICKTMIDSSITTEFYCRRWH